MTAACLVLTAGIAGTVGWIQLHVPEPESVLTQDTATTAAIEEIKPETVTVAAAEAEPFRETADAAPKQTKTQTVQTQAAEPQQTAPTPSGAESDAEQQPVKATQAQTEAKGGKADTRQTEAKPALTAATPQTQKASQQTKPVTETKAAASYQGTEPEPKEGDAAVQPVEETQAPGSSVKPPFNGEASGYFAYETYYGNGYRLELVENEKYADKEYYIRFLRDDPTYYPETEQFSVALDGYECTTEHPTPSSTRNSIVNEATGFSATVQFHGAYYSWRIVHSNITTTATTLNIGGETVPALYLTRDNSEELIWFDGMYFCTLYCKPGFYEEMRAVAEAMQTH